jgi:mycothiol synthase
LEVTERIPILGTENPVEVGQGALWNQTHIPPGRTSASKEYGNLRSRPYGGADDLTRVSRFLSECTSLSPPQTYWHPGDFVWTLFQNTLFDAARNVRLWEDGGGIVGVAILEEPDGVVMQIRPDLRGSGTVERPMLLWAVECLTEETLVEKIRTTHLETLGAQDDPTLQFLERTGFLRVGTHYLNMHRSLNDGSSISPATPDGWSVRPVGPEDEWQRRVDLHREVWSPSRVTMEAYRRLRAAPDYDPNLDLVAVNGAGELGAYCICWYDPGSRSGLFEPVGTAEAHRRRGLGRAVMEEGLARLTALGAKDALVTSEGRNDASRLLYESVGFRTVGIERLYEAKTDDLARSLTASKGSR